MIRRKRDGRTFFIFDCHTHLGENSLLERFRHKGRKFLPEQMVPWMDHYGQDIVVGFPVVDSTSDYSKMTYQILEGAQAHPQRIVPFTRANPNYEKRAADLISEYAAVGIKGIKFHPVWESFPANDPVLVRPIMEEANKYGMVCLFHSGETWMSLPGLVFDLAQDYKDVKFIIGHCGLYGFDTEAMVMARRSDNIWLDTTELYPPQRIRTVVNNVGKEKVVFGSDSPYLNTAAEIEKVMRFSALTDDELDPILGRNLARLLGVDPDLPLYKEHIVDYPIDEPFFD